MFQILESVTFLESPKYAFCKNNKSKIHSYPFRVANFLFAHSLFILAKYCIKIFPDTIKSFYLLANGFFYKWHLKEKNTRFTDKRILAKYEISSRDAGHFLQIR